MAVNSVPIWEKANLNLEEAAAYFGIGINKLRDMTNENNCPFVLWNGNNIRNPRSPWKHRAPGIFFILVALQWHYNIKSSSFLTASEVVVLYKCP